MGVSASSLLDDTKSAFIRGQAEAELNQFSPFYRRQFSVARFCHVEDELEQNKEKMTQLLRQKEAPEEAEVLYEEGVFYFDDTRKWRERYVVVRANYCLECHESLETFVKGVPPRHKLLPTGGAVLTTEERYMAMVDRCFPDDTGVKEEFAPPLSGMPGQFPVYLRLPYRRDSYFCFRQQAKQDAFLSILNDCIRHQNQDFLKRKTCEVQAFLKAIQLYRQDKGRYEAWDMLIGSDVRVMANVVMEQLLPSLEKDMLPRLKAKKTEKKRVWFATVEAAYILVQEHLLEGLTALKDDCRASVRQQEVLIHSDMDQILQSRRQLEEKVRAQVSEPAEKLCSESVQPYLGSVLEELMEPISSGFLEGRQLSEATMDRVCQDFLGRGDKEQLKKALSSMGRPNLLSCFQRISSLQEKLQHLHDRFGFSNITGLIHSAQIDLQLLMENAAFTFEQLLHKAVQDNPDNAGPAVEKVKHRVLKQYDYDSSTGRKRISQEALVSITLPFIKRSLAPTCKTGLQSLEQSIDSEHSNFLHVENVYESVLLQLLDNEVTKVVKEAASLKKYNLFTDSRDLVSQSSRSSLSSPPVSTPGSPAMALASPANASSEPQPPSPLVGNGVSPSPQKGEEQAKEEGGRPDEASADHATTIETPLGKVEQKEIELSAVVQEAEPPAPAAAAEEVVQTVKAEADIALETAAVAETTAANETQEVKAAAAPETERQEEVSSVQTETVETRSSEAAAVDEVSSAGESLKTDAEEAPDPSPDPAAEETGSKAPEPSPDPAAEETGSKAPEPSPDPAAEETGSKAPEPSPDPAAEETGSKAPEPSPDPAAEETGSKAPDPSPDPAAEETGSEAADSSEGASEVEQEAPSGGEAPAALQLEGHTAEPAAASHPNSLDASAGSESPPSTEEVKVTQSGEDDVPTTSDLSKSPASSDDAPEDKSASGEASPGGGDIEAGAGVDVNAEASTSPSSEEAPSSPEPRPLGCVKGIRDLVVEVIEVEEPLQRYPSGVPKDE